MTISKGNPWGHLARPPATIRHVTDDVALHDWVNQQRGSGAAIADVALRGGDLARTAGGGSPDRFDGEVLAAPFDVVRVTADDGRQVWSCSHIVARRSWWRGEVAFAMTAQYLGSYDVAPRSHPNDGKVDIVRVAAQMPYRARLAARTRARTGTHLPHPQLAFAQSTEATLTFARPLVVWVDGRRWGTATTLHLVVEPDAYTGYV
jgi:hypothetical protein